MSQSEYVGKRCVGLTRTSTLIQSEHGIQQQGEVCRRHAEKLGMIWVDAEEAPGVSGYQTEVRADIDRIIARKKSGEDFQVVIVHDYSRLTRGGVDHGSFLLWRFSEVGLKVVSATNDIPDNEYAPLLRTLEFMKDHAYSEKTALNTARGRMAAIMDGRSTHCGQPPFAVDRLYLSDKGEKLFRIRNLPDGRQLKLTPDVMNEQVLGVYQPNEKLEDGSVLMRHFKKQPHERVTLVPGDPEDVRTVRYILHRFYVEGVKPPTITLELNTAGRRANDGGLWNISSVSDVVYQPVYVGRGICNFLNEAKIYNRSKDQPRRVRPREDETRKMTYRPEEEWVKVEYASLQGSDGFLPPNLHNEVYERQLQRYRDRGNGVNRRNENDSHTQSSFFLKEAIYTSTGYRMRGHRSNASAGGRYYVWTKNIETPTHGNREKRYLFPAKPVEEAVLQVVCEVLSDVEVHLDTVREYVKRRVKETLGVDTDRQALLQERKGVADELAFCVNELAVLGPEMLKKKIEPLKVRLIGLDARIKMAQRTRDGLIGNADDIMKAVENQMRYASANASDITTPAFRALIASLTRTVVDLDNRTAEIEVRVPIFEIADARRGEDAVRCLVSPLLPTCGTQTQLGEGLVLAKIRCSERREGRYPCLTCSRSAA